METKGLDEVRRKHGIALIVQFGSTVGGAVRAESDLDIGVLFDGAPRYDDVPRIASEIGEILPGREVDLAVVDLPPLARLEFLLQSARAGVRGGRVYDAHITATARASRAKLIVTDNRRHFAGLAGEDVRVVDASASLKLVERGGRERA